MSIRNSKLLRIFLSLFVLNSLFLCMYFTLHSPPPPESRPALPEFRFRSPANRLIGQKPWPILPSYLPWNSPDRKVPLGSCEGYFGNGFRRRVDVLSPPRPADRAGSSWFRCFYSETLRSSICEGGNMRMVPDRIRMSRGGERLDEVMGREEEEELPVFQDGAFEIVKEGLGLGFNRGLVGGRGNPRRLVGDDLLNRYVAEGDMQRHTMRDLVASIRIVDSRDFACDEWVEEPTLLVTRFEYANLFHTVTDWYSAYASSRVTGLPNRPNVVFVDGHCRTQLEETWKALFSGIRYAKNFTGSACFRHVILSPLGYETALFKGLSEEIECRGTSAHDLWQNPDDHRTARISEFGEMISAAFGLSVGRHRLEKRAPVHNVLFVRREDYLAHPRHVGKVESRLSNEKEIFDSLEAWVSTNRFGCKVNLTNGLFAHMPMKQQVRAIQDASVIIGAHGAGLTHIVSAAPKAVVLEIISSQFRRPHFALISQWKGLEYHAINLPGSYADPAAVIDNLSSIMRSLGC